ncbi:NUDIX domain-containing protein [Methanosphaera sp. Vir-13MRS]|uniref:NUDIX domain-containing protein n=1 Tax=Candidatus Methanosphaera massiliense TaxID=3017187 RepID=UPI0023809AAE|nr:NUDIX domain-containing protein [Candidatus Methanosphaera massiliense]MDE4078682.1 NUDIX domain-containing protein [Candidatus Methanosphaera massiliense]
MAAIIFKDERIFATQRGYGEFKDLWEFPGGKIESGESLRRLLCVKLGRSLTLILRCWILLLSWSGNILISI